MGLSVSDIVKEECSCQGDGLMGFCGPEDPGVEEQKEFTEKEPRQAYPKVPKENRPPPRPPTNSRPQPGDTGQRPVDSGAWPEASSWGESHGAAAWPVAEPVGASAHEGAGDWPSAWPEAPPAAPGPAEDPWAGELAPVRDEPAQAPAPARGHGLTMDHVLSDLDGCEERVYGEAFRDITGGAPVGHDHEGVREFLVGHSALSNDNLDLMLFSLVPDPPLTAEGFLRVLRECPCLDEDCLTQFMGLSSDGENVASDECRSGLVVFAQQHLSTNFSEERWDCVLNMVMMDADVLVSMEAYIRYCKLVGRTARLVGYCQL